MADETFNHIALRLKQIRRERDMTQSQVAAIAGTDTNYYAKIERGEAIPSLKMFLSITKALKAKTSDILPF